MKFRMGFISNSSSTSFAIPSFLLTDEQKEILLSVADDLQDKIDKKLIENGQEPVFSRMDHNYPRNDDYHNAYKMLIAEGAWCDSGWSVNESQDEGLIHGSTLMHNGGMIQLMRAIGIDEEMIEWHGDNGFKKAKNPDSADFFRKYLQKFVEVRRKEFDNLSPDDKIFWIEAGWRIPDDYANPYDQEDEDEV